MAKNKYGAGKRINGVRPLGQSELANSEDDAQWQSQTFKSYSIIILFS